MTCTVSSTGSRRRPVIGRPDASLLNVPAYYGDITASESRGCTECAIGGARGGRVKGGDRAWQTVWVEAEGSGQQSRRFH